MKGGRTILVLFFLLSIGFLVKAQNIRINEIMYHPSSEQGGDYYGEWIEIYNPNNYSINLSGWKLCNDELLVGYINKTDGKLYSFNKTLLTPGDYTLITDGGTGTKVYDKFNVNDSALAFHTDSGSLCGGLNNNGGDNITLFDSNGSIIDQVNYSNSWGGNGNEKTLEFYNNSWYQSFIINGTPGAENSIYNCTPNWTLVLDDKCYFGDYKIGWFNDTNNCVSKTENQTILIKTKRPTNITIPDSCDFEGNGIIGSISEINFSGPEKNISIEINNSRNLSRSFGGFEKVKIKNYNRTIVEFYYNFSFDSLNLSSLVIEQEENNSFGFMIIRGLNLSRENQTKTIYLNRILDGTGVCIKDSEIFSIDEISPFCNGANEFWVSCPGNSGNYNCSIIDGKYKITGLKHSGVKEQETYCGDSLCSSNETCSSCSKDCGVCGGNSDYCGKVLIGWVTPEILKRKYTKHLLKSSQKQKMLNQSQNYEIKNDSDNSVNYFAMTGAFIKEIKMFKKDNFLIFFFCILGFVEIYIKLKK